MRNERGVARVLAVPAMAVLLAGVASAQGTAAGQTSAARLMIPHESWACGMPDGIPDPDAGTLVFTAEMSLDRVADIGRTQYGRRQVAVAREGTFTGSKVSGTVMTGALDFELTLGNGVIEIEQIFVLRTAEGKYVYLRTAGTGPDAKDVRVVMDFEAPNASDVAWLNSGAYVARRMLNAAAKTLTLRVYDVSSVKPPANLTGAIRISKPSGRTAAAVGLSACSIRRKAGGAVDCRARDAQPEPVGRRDQARESQHHPDHRR